MAYLGEIRMFAGNFAPLGWAFCDGSLQAISQNQWLFQLLGTTYGGDGQVTFALPDLRGRGPLSRGQGPGLSNRTLGERAGSETVALTQNHMPAHTHSLSVSTAAASTASTAGSVPATLPSDVAWAAGPATEAMTPTFASGGSQPHENRQPYLAINYIICVDGVFPSEGSFMDDGDFDPLLGEIQMFGFNYAPRGWATCQGQTMSIQQNTALFAILGTTYGGDGRQTFGLPNLAGRVPLGQGQGPALSPYALGQTGGATTVTLTTSEMPSHTHSLSAFPGAATTANPATAVPATSETALYGPAAGAGRDVGVAGGSQPHGNMQPFTVLNYCIAFQGVFPPRS